MAEQNQTVKKHYINAGSLIFGAILVYLILIIYSGMHVTQIAGYEVTEGSLAIDSTYRGVALRAEQVVSANNNGYINYYAGESEHISNGGLVYSIDESGVLSEMIKDSAAINTVLSDEALSELRTELIGFATTYDDRDFYSVYRMQDSVEGTIRKLANQSALEDLRSISSNAYGDLVDMGYAPDSGVVVYNYDNMEGMTASLVTDETFDEGKYQKTQLVDGDLVSGGDPAYKLITSENWQVVFPLDETTKEAISSNSAVKVRFLKNDYESTAKVEIINNNDKDYGCLYLNDSMIAFATDRFVDIELVLEEIRGLKVPNSAIVNREFYVIPVDYATDSTARDTAGFLRRIYLEDGTESTEYVSADIYNRVDDDFYIDTSVFAGGDVLVKPDSSGTFTVSNKKALTGVYNMNKGYADFTKINVINSNKEYSIVESESMYDLQVYDYIVLDGDGVNDSDFVTDTDLKNGRNGKE
ncbi:MAG: hypothetical protein IJ641_07235 [Lachnospiraceae bacterium]|nr:hypothetical protein [Lachnospiraceae bacterium]